MMFRKSMIIAVLFLPVASGVPAQDIDKTKQPSEKVCQEDMPLLPLPLLLAQADMDEPLMGGPGGRHGRAKRYYMQAMDQQRQHLEQLRMLKLLELLDLDEDIEITFLTSFRGMRKDISEIQKRRQQLIEELVDSLKEEKVDRAQVDQAVKNLFDLEQEKNRIIQNFLKESRDFLTPEQLGKFIVFQERFELELLERLKDFHDRKGPEKP